MTVAVPSLRVLALVKQIPAFESMVLGPDGRLERDGPLEMSAYCRRAVAQAVALVEKFGGEVVVATLGPPPAADVLREAIAYGTDRGVAIGGVLVSDGAFAGSDTLATATALAATIGLLEAEAGAALFDLVLCGRNSVDADTGQVGPELAQLLDLPFVTGAKQLALSHDPTITSSRRQLAADVGCELDDTWLDVTVTLPAVISTAERLIDPCKLQDPEIWATVDGSLIQTIHADQLGPGPWGAAASPTSVGEIRFESVDRVALVLDGSLAEQVASAIAFLADRGALVPGSLHTTSSEVVASPAVFAEGPRPVVAVVVEPDRVRLAGELLGAAARLAIDIGGSVVALGPLPLDATELATMGADEVIEIVAGGAVGERLTGEGGPVGPTDQLAEEDVADALTAWARHAEPWAVVVGGTSWGREVAARSAAALGAGLTGDAVGLVVDGGRLLAWKPAFGGSLVAAIRSSSSVQMATVRGGVLPLHQPRPYAAEPVRHTIEVIPRRRVVVRDLRREDDLDALATAEMVVGVGQGFDPGSYPELDGLLGLLGAELAATRKVTDNGWLPRARQLGITGHSISPRLYVAIGLSGKFNHLVGVRSAGTILAINPDPTAPVFAACDIGIVAPWEDAVPELERQLRRHHA
jgi:electron transfer flavoprotein alpha subunit